MEHSANHYRRTMVSCFVGIFVQAIISNLTAILFIPLMDLYGFTYIHLGILVAVNFGTQVAADIIFSGIIDRVGYKKLVLPTDLFACLGLILFACAPQLFPGREFIGILLATIVFSFSSGLLEVLMSPIVNDIPYKNKGPAMSLMHSFYAWGQVATIIITTLFVFLFGGKNWQIIVFLWVLVPLFNFFMFLSAPFPKPVSEEKRQGMRQLLFQPFYLIALAAILCGASTEVVMNQWASSFMEKGLELPKIVGDLLGMCGFAVMLGLGRTLHGAFGARYSIHQILIGTSILSIICYLTVAFCPVVWINVAACALCGLGASLLWPGTLVAASEQYPLAGAWLFAILAAAGDIGASVGPWLVGLVTDRSMENGTAARLASFLQTTTEQASMRLGILFAAIFPVIAVICHVVLKNKARKAAK